MEAAAQEQQNKSRVVKVDSVESWENFVSQANNQGCPVCQCSSHNPPIFISKRRSIDNTVSLIIIAGSCTLYCYLVHAFCGHESII